LILSTEETRLTKPGDFKKAGHAAKTYIDELMKPANYDEGIDALAAGDDQALLKLFKKCKVPDDKVQSLLAQAKACYQLPTSMW
jgi:hypothetical protein